MTFKEFYISDKNGKSNCVIKSLCKVAKELNCSSFNDTPVFEKYMEDNDIIKISCSEDIKVNDLKIDNLSDIVFCYDKKDFPTLVELTFFSKYVIVEHNYLKKG